MASSSLSAAEPTTTRPNHVGAEYLKAAWLGQIDRIKAIQNSSLFAEVLPVQVGDAYLSAIRNDRPDIMQEIESSGRFVEIPVRILAKYRAYPIFPNPWFPLQNRAALEHFRRSGRYDEVKSFLRTRTWQSKVKKQLKNE